jgi:hypothetical protein
MSEAEASNGDRKRQTGSDDLLSALAVAWSDLWSMGTSEAAIGSAHLDRTALSAPFAPFARATAGVMRDLTLASSEPLSGESRLTDHQNAKDIAVLLARAYLVATVGGLRYWRRVAQIYGMHQSSILKSLLPRPAGPGVSEGERRVQADEVCAYLREIGELSAQEARAFQAELEKLAEGVASVVCGSQQATENRRRWRAKP